MTTTFPAPCHRSIELARVPGGIPKVYPSEGRCNKPAAAEQINEIEYHRGGEQS